MASFFFRLTSVAVLVISTFGCNPSPTPGNPVREEIYSKVTFSMKNVNIKAQWTGPSTGNAVSPQKALGSSVEKSVIAKDIDRMIDIITAAYKLPQDMINVNVDANEALTIDFPTSKVECAAGSFTGTTTQLIFYDEATYVTQCLATTVPNYVRKTFTITGKLLAAVPATKKQWEFLAYQLQNDLITRNYVVFNDEDLTIDYKSGSNDNA